MTKDIKSRDLLKYGEAISQGFQDGTKDTEQWRQFREKVIADAGDAATRDGKALIDATVSISGFVAAMAEIAAVIIRNLPAEIEKRTALSQAPPKVRHLAEHGKKRRTRKKNINRALREYRRKDRK